MSAYDQRPEHAARPSGAVQVLGVSACGTVAVPLVVLAAHAVGLSWIWAAVLGLCTPSLFLLLWGVLLAVGPRSCGTAVAVPVRDRSPQAGSPAQVPSAA